MIIISWFLAKIPSQCHWLLCWARTLFASRNNPRRHVNMHHFQSTTVIDQTSCNGRIFLGQFSVHDLAMKLSFRVLFRYVWTAERNTKPIRFCGMGWDYINGLKMGWWPTVVFTSKMYSIVRFTPMSKQVPFHLQGSRDTHICHMMTGIFTRAYKRNPRILTQQ